MIIVHFEVYVLEGRGWMLHARFPRLERDEAVREAKELETTLGIRVKVVRETYNTDTNHFDEVEVYLSGHVTPARRPAAGGGNVSSGGKAAAAASGKATPGKASAGKKAAARATNSLEISTSGAAVILFRLTIIMLAAAGLALGALRLVPTIVVFLYDYGLRVTPDSYGQLLFAVFALVFLMTAVPLAVRYIPRNGVTVSRRTRVQSVPAARPQTDPNVKKALDKLAKKVAADAIPDSWADDPEPPPALADPDDDLPPIIPDPEADLPEVGPRDEAAEWDKEPSAAAAAIDALPSTPALESCRAVADRFLDHAIGVVRQSGAALDKYNSFALNLYMAGGLKTLAAAKGLDSGGQRKLLKAALIKLGTPPDMAAQFHDKLPEYMGEQRYQSMVETGRAAMESWVAGDETTPQIKLLSAIKAWNRPTAEKKPSIMTVMFTDMVGSTDLTQAKGDVAAQEIVRRHNAIVRTALTQFAGHEVKHTGDGIMASFASAANAVDATIQIQRQVRAHNEKQPNLVLHLRIGLNSGEPIQEEDDLFGSTVQLAARVCAATQSDQTLCTQVVKDLAGAKGNSFRDGGTHALKGFRDKFQLWDVVWQ